MEREIREVISETWALRPRDRNEQRSKPLREREGAKGARGRGKMYYSNSVFTCTGDAVSTGSGREY